LVRSPALDCGCFNVSQHRAEYSTRLMGSCPGGGHHPDLVIQRPYGRSIYGRSPSCCIRSLRAIVTSDQRRSQLFTDGGPSMTGYRLCARDRVWGALSAVLTYLKRITVFHLRYYLELQTYALDWRESLRYFRGAMVGIPSSDSGTTHILAEVSWGCRFPLCWRAQSEPLPSCDQTSGSAAPFRSEEYCGR